MKTAMYFNQSDEQLVLTAESEWEKSILKSLEQRLPAGLVFVGGFYECKGGWIRQGYYGTEDSPQSLIIRLPKKEATNDSN